MMKNNDEQGWISLHRKVKKHWLWESPERFQRWIDMLITVNHTDKKVLIGTTLIECKRGQSVRSLNSWAMDWNISKGAVRDFFKLLHSDNMIISENLKSTTRITICNYDSYQASLHTEGTPRKHKGYPNNNGNNVNNKSTMQKIEYNNLFKHDDR